MSPGCARSSALWSIRLSLGWHWTVKAGPQMRTPFAMGLMAQSTYPFRPEASWTVAVPMPRNRSMISLAGLSILLIT